MGGSPKLAVDNIKEILNINQQRSDYLGEPLPPPPPDVLPLRWVQAGVGSLPSFPARPQAVSFCVKAAESCSSLVSNCLWLQPWFLLLAVAGAGFCLCYRGRC